LIGTERAAIAVIHPNNIESGAELCKAWDRKGQMQTKGATMKTSRLIVAGVIIVALCLFPGSSFSTNEAGKKQPAQAKTTALKISIEGEGTSIEKPIVIKGAPDNMAGVALEYAVLRGLYPTAKVKNQQLMKQGGRSYDVMVLKLRDGRELRVFFDITDFFGKMPL
jgi:hypothetical protein